MRLLFALILLFEIAAGADLAEGDPLRRIQDEMTGATCCRFEFISVFESGVFDSVDSTWGEALIAADGRYTIMLGSDRYVRTDKLFYGYSQVQNQVTVEPAGSGDDEEISFITRLDHYYRIAPVDSDAQYILTRDTTRTSQLPDEMILFLTEDTQRLARLEYRDLNDDLNRIILLRSENLAACDSTALAPNFPDSVQVIKLY